MNLHLLPNSFKPGSCHKFEVCILSRFPIARPLTLPLFGFLQYFFLMVNKVSILPSNIDNIHDEFVDADNRKCIEIWFTAIVCTVRKSSAVTH